MWFYWSNIPLLNFLVIIRKYSWTINLYLINTALLKITDYSKLIKLIFETSIQILIAFNNSCIAVYNMSI